MMQLRDASEFFCSLNLDTSPKVNRMMQPASMIELTICENGYFMRDQIRNDFVSLHRVVGRTVDFLERLVFKDIISVNDRHSITVGYFAYHPCLINTLAYRCFISIRGFTSVFE